MQNGVIKEAGLADRSYYTSADIIELLGVSKSKAYEIIKKTRDACIESGKLSAAYPVGKCPKKVINEKFMIE